MSPPHEVFDEFRADLSATQEHPGHLMTKELLDGLDLRSGRNSEHVLAVEPSVGEQDVTMGVELEQAAESLDRNDRTGLELFTRQDLLKVLLEGLPGASAELAKELSVIKKGPAKNFRDAQDPVAVGDGFNNLLKEPLAEFDHTLLMAVAAGIAADSSEAVMEDAAVKKPVDDVSHIRPKESVLAGKAFIVDLFQGLEVVFHALIE
jgi:hypothetical protein